MQFTLPIGVYSAPWDFLIKKLNRFPSTDEKNLDQEMFNYLKRDIKKILFESLSNHAPAQQLKSYDYTPYYASEICSYQILNNYLIHDDNAKQETKGRVNCQYMDKSIEIIVSSCIKVPDKAVTTATQTNLQKLLKISYHSSQLQLVQLRFNKQVIYIAESNQQAL